MRETIKERLEKWQAGFRRHLANLWMRLADQRGQGTTEYAILVGVLVVIAIIAVVAFREKLADLWNSISSAINSL
jgi:Flp pilus assembly pilin Flp